MKPYIYNIIFLLSIHFSFAQTKELVLRESYEIDENTILEIDIDNASIVFEESNDHKVHLDYSILFNKDSEEIQYKVFKGINAKSSKRNNKIKLDVKNSMYLGELYSIDVDIEIYKEHIRDFFKQIKKNKFFYKSKDSIVKEIDFSLGGDSNDYFKKLKLENPSKNYGKSPRKFKQDFIIKVPKNVKIKIKALHSRIDFTYDVNTHLDVSSFKTYYKFKSINNKKNTFKLMSGIFQAREIIGGNYDIKDIYKVRIGSITDAIFKTETSTIQIGEIGENVSFKDFTSKVHLFNFIESFSDFNFEGKYSELSLYNVKESNYTMSVFGFNTVLNMDDNKISFGDSKEEKLTKILAKKPKDTIIPNGNIAIELKNGILNIK
ncbi:hypothetical protein [Polaribacter sp. Asnod1-A03]|uniref:hypothetical protein n=1 Tax=Polaribacter sp. Asnod1-A03 TaxID=3160581 RepID=UPI0038668DB6